MRSNWDRKHGVFQDGPKTQNRSLECIHLGDVVNKHNCNSGLRWEHECDRHGRCTRSHRDRKDVPCCLTCPDFSEGPDESPASPPTRNVILWNKQSPGDCLVMTAAIECLHQQHPGKFKTAVRCAVPAIFENNPRVVPPGDGWETIEMHCPHVHQSDARPIHFMESYCRYLGERLGVTIELTVNRPQLHFSQVEGTWISRVHEVLGRPAKHWLINAGVKQDYTAKGWITDCWQEVVDRLRGEVLFVQVGEPHHKHPKLRGVIDQVGKTNAREFLRLCRSAEGGIGPVTYLQHCMAALGKPYVCVAGGREPPTWTAYNTQTTLSAIGALDCCRHGGCWKSRVVPLGDGDRKDGELCVQTVQVGDSVAQRCMMLIHPEHVVDAVLKHYRGGALTYDEEVPTP